MSMTPKYELDQRMSKLKSALTTADPHWSMVIINHKVNMFYLTGTMQEGALVLTPNDSILWVRRSLERAKRESLFGDIRPMRSFRTLAEHYVAVPQQVYVETKTASLDWLAMVQKALPFVGFASINPFLSRLRSIKSDYELTQMRKAGEIAIELYENVLPTLLKEGMSEPELAADLFKESLVRGSMGVARCNLPAGEDVIGICSFGTNSLLQTAFDGVGGIKGTCEAMPMIGDFQTKLEKNTSILLDIPTGSNGYLCDKSFSVYFGDMLDDENFVKITKAFQTCKHLEEETARLLRPGAILEEVYAAVIQQVPREYETSFMGGARFLGHSLGLTMDETPVIAPGFKDVVEVGMTFAIEPKIALAGIGVVGCENVYVICQNIAQNISAISQNMLVVSGK